MADLASYAGIVNALTIVADTTALPIGTRVVMESNGLYTLAGNSVRGTLTTLQDIGASTPGKACSTSAGIVPALADANATTVNAPAYAGANGTYTVTTGTAATFMGYWKTVTTASTLGVVELSTIA